MMLVEKENSKDLTVQEVVSRLAKRELHVHFEGALKGRRPFQSETPWEYFLGCLATPNIQIGMVDAHENPNRWLEDHQLRQELENGLRKSNFPFGNEIDDRVKAMMLFVYDLGKKAGESLPPESRVLVSPHNASADVNGLTSLVPGRLSPRAEEVLKDGFPENFTYLTFGQYLAALGFGLNPRRLVISLRRDCVEADYLQFSDASSKETFIDQLLSLYKRGLIDGFDIGGYELALSVKEMERFIIEAQTKGVPFRSLHAGEVGLEGTAVGLKNIVDGLEFFNGLSSLGIGHGYALFSLINAESDDPVLAKQKEELRALARRLGCEGKKLDYGTLAQKIVEKIKSKRGVIHVCLGSVLFTLVPDSPPEESLIRLTPGTPEFQSVFKQKLQRHPLVAYLIKKGPEGVADLPPIAFSTDDWVVSGYFLQQELELLVEVLRENDWQDVEIVNFFLKVTPA